ncbi:MAG: TIR domain-containing protein [Lewinellaceae bacterium]|nr:TIR domain-containing protein [Lewinellaceae bacterium]
MKYKAFISYRHTENGRRHAIALETALKRYAKPTLARPMKIFRDEKHFKPDISLPKLIQDGLENSEYLVFLAEKASAESPWCGQELEQWCNPEKLNRTQNLIIALIDDDFATNETHNDIDWEKTTALPALLQPYLTSIPLYMDLRWAKSATDTDLQHPKYRHEINALAARLRGVNPEDLNDEEIQVFRRNIRLRNGAIGVLLAMLGVSVGAAWWAIKQQGIAATNASEANKQRLVAEKQTALAIKNEQKANEKTAEAQRNLDKAIAAEEQTRQALIQVQNEKNATEAQRREAQKNFENAERERKRAESQLAATKLTSIRKLPEN